MTSEKYMVNGRKISPNMNVEVLVHPSTLTRKQTGYGVSWFIVPLRVAAWVGVEHP